MNAAPQRNSTTESKLNVAALISCNFLVRTYQFLHTTHDVGSANFVCHATCVVGLDFHITDLATTNMPSHPSLISNPRWPRIQNSPCFLLQSAYLHAFYQSLYNPVNGQCHNLTFTTAIHLCFIQRSAKTLLESLADYHKIIVHIFVLLQRQSYCSRSLWNISYKFPPGRRTAQSYLKIQSQVNLPFFFHLQQKKFFFFP